MSDISMDLCKNCLWQIMQLFVCVQSINKKKRSLCLCFSQTSAVLCSGGCALLAVSSLLAIITIFLPSGGCERRVCTLAGYMQMAAGWYTRAAHALTDDYNILTSDGHFFFFLELAMSRICVEFGNMFSPACLLRRRISLQKTRERTHARAQNSAHFIVHQAQKQQKKRMKRNKLEDSCC